jgi:hypothetical protein
MQIYIDKSIVNHPVFECSNSLKLYIALRFSLPESGNEIEYNAGRLMSELRYEIEDVVFYITKLQLYGLVEIDWYKVTKKIKVFDLYDKIPFGGK